MSSSEYPGRGAVPFADAPAELFVVNETAGPVAYPAVEMHSAARPETLSLGENNIGQAPHSRSRQLQLALKRAMDIVLTVPGLVFLGPLFLFVALAIKLTSPGPVYFVQEREGMGGRRFRAFKFRTMYSDRCDPSGVSHTIENDPRVTPLGRWLRRTSIDELPQLFNVLRGDMSLVGPRPHVAGMLAAGQPYDRVVPFYAVRHQVLPGITGWAQVNGLRGRIETLEQARARIEHDIAYVHNFSLALDLKILARTLLVEFVTGSGD